MVTDPIQHDRAKGDRLRLMSRHSWRVVRGASYSKYDTLSVAWSFNPERRGGGDEARGAANFLWDNVGHGGFIGFRLCLTMPRRE